ncbi:hypothetical protein GCM10009809_26160 [Isoptericola hypogeus]|uniref:glucan endo-1,3-beta-D-glucosidase n=1 Tax=Isoptericola hypogeus TaxID=300179 RepID=A0ABN2JJK4_9MICO
MRGPRALVGVAVVAPVVALVTAACGVLGGGPGGDGSSPAGGSAAPGASAGAAPAADRAGVPPDVDPGVLPQESVAVTPTMRLADGLAPPTNRWFSALALGDAPQPVFPLPLAVAMTSRGFGYGLPDVEVTETSVVGPYAEQVGVDVGAASFVVSTYDTASVTVELRDGAGEPLGHLQLVEGSPVLRYTAATDQDVAMTSEFTVAGGRASTEVLDREHVLVTPGGAGDPGAGLSEDGRVLELGAGQAAAWFPVPDDVSADAVDTLVRAAAAPVTETSLAYGAGDEAVTTAITYATDDGDPTAVVRMPHQRDSTGAACGLGTYATVHGTVEACTASTLAWASPAVEPAGRLDLSGLDDDERAELADQVRADASARAEGTLEAPSDTYFGGKALARDANLLTLAEQLRDQDGMDDVAGTLRDDLAARLREWAEADGCERRAERCFVHDPALATVVGKVPGFGSEEANDHHFHYGYFLYAAGVVAAGDSAGEADPALVDDLAPVLDLLAADVAAGEPVGGLPALRVFDAYAGHSWASGYAPFADGNNQESASEAVAAWNGLALWAAARGDADLEAQARWLLSAEAASARAYWTDFDRSDPAVQGFGHQVTSLVWGGKRDWATWFSAEPSAMLGILVLPAQPVAGYLAGDPERIRANLDEALAGRPRDEAASWDVMFGDQLLLYAALAGPDDAQAALDVARDLPDERLDDGNTRSYLLAFLMAHAS